MDSVQHVRRGKKMSLLNNNIQMGAVSLRVKNLLETKQFYTEVIGLEVIREDESFVSLGVDGEALVLLNQVESLSHDTGLYHMAFLLPSENDLTAFLFHASKINFNIDGAGDHIYSQAFYLHDNEGNGIEIYADRPKKDWPYIDPTTLKGMTEEVDIQAMIDRYNGEPWTKMPSGSIMGHVHLQVRDLDKAKQFYGDFLGMDILTNLPTALFMSKNGYHHHLGMNTWQKAKPSEQGALISYEIKVDNLDNIKNSLENQNEYEFKETDKGFLVHDGQGIWTHLVRSDD